MRKRLRCAFPAHKVIQQNILGERMKAFVTALIVLAVVGMGTYAVLDGKMQMSADQAFATSGARVTPHH